MNEIYIHNQDSILFKVTDVSETGIKKIDGSQDNFAVVVSSKKLYDPNNRISIIFITKNVKLQFMYLPMMNIDDLYNI